MDGISQYIAEVAKAIGRNPNDPYAMMIGLQMLQVAIYRIGNGTHINDFLDGPQKVLPEVHQIYREIVDSKLLIETAVKKLKLLNEEYVRFCVREYRVAEMTIRDTGLFDDLN